MSGFGVDLEVVVDGILGLMNVFTYCAVEENKWRKLVAGSLAAALVAFLLKPASPSSFCFALNWIGSDGIDSSLGIDRSLFVGHFAERMYVLLLGGDWSEEKMVNESDPVVT